MEGIHALNKELTQMLPDGGVFINSARGSLVDTKALIAQLQAGRIYAVLDVYEEENNNVYEDRSDAILENSTVARLLNFPNVMVTSHQGFFAKEALEAISSVTMENALAFMHGKKNGNEVE